MIVIGIDPDSSKHGVAIYEYGELVRLESMDLIDVLDMAHGFSMKGDDPVFHIENVDANKAYWHNKSGSKAAFGRSASDMGKCRQAQIELVRALERRCFKCVMHGISKRWKDAKIGKAEFQLITGWTGKSNEDTRSAAYFGAVGCGLTR